MTPKQQFKYYMPRTFAEWLFLVGMFLVGMSLHSCKSIKATTTSSVDTLVRLVSVKVPFDTTLNLKGHNSSFVAPVTIEKGLPQMPEKTLTENGITTTARVKDGQLEVNTRTQDTAIRVRGETTGQVAQTTIRQKEITTITEKPGLFQRIWSGIKNFILEIIVVVAIILVVIAFIKR